VRYDYAHDPLSYPLGGEGAPPPQEVEEEVGDDGHVHHTHKHALAPTVAGTLRWLKRHSSFPSEVPEVGLVEIWEGREDGLFTAVLKGLEALHKRMEALQRENAQLQKELASFVAMTCVISTCCDPKPGHPFHPTRGSPCSCSSKTSIFFFRTFSQAFCSRLSSALPRPFCSSKTYLPLLFFFLLPRFAWHPLVEYGRTSQS
jgi:hypothetical protein